MNIEQVGFLPGKDLCTENFHFFTVVTYCIPVEIHCVFIYLSSVNQVEVHPYCTREELDAYCKSMGILLQAYSPLAKGERFDDPKLINMAKK